MAVIYYLTILPPGVGQGQEGQNVSWKMNFHEAVMSYDVMKCDLMGLDLMRCDVMSNVWNCPPSPPSRMTAPATATNTHLQSWEHGWQLKSLGHFSYLLVTGFRGIGLIAKMHLRRFRRFWGLKEQSWASRYSQNSETQETWDPGDSDANQVKGDLKGNSGDFWYYRDPGNFRLWQYLASFSRLCEWGVNISRQYPTVRSSGWASSGGPVLSWGRIAWRMPAAYCAAVQCRGRF